MILDPYLILGVKSNSSFKEIKSAYRELVKKHHPDAGGDEQTILSVNAAWEILGDEENRQAYDLAKKVDESLFKETKNRDFRNAQASSFVNSAHKKVAKEENELYKWLQYVYTPINKLIGEIINLFSKKIRDLSADPYDDLLMEEFCSYLEDSEKKIKKIHRLYQSLSIPIAAKELGLSVYHCFSQVEDALHELEIYTHGYVDNYLHDGTEMIREAKKKRKEIQQQRRNLPIS